MKESIIKEMRKKGLKLTPQRLSVIDVLTGKNLLHPNARSIYKEAKRKAGGLSLSTVYLTLNELSRHGIIKILEFDKMENRYEGNTSDHLNLVCVGCGRIEDYIKPLPVSAREVERKTGFRPHEVRFEYYGYCRKCLGRVE